MKHPRYAVVPAALSAAVLAVSVAGAQPTLPRLSPNAAVTQTIGITDFSLTYSRPGVKGRVIWGGLVPYDSTWRTGANEPTTLTVSDTILVAGRKLAAGKYAIVTIPRPGEWTVIFSAQKDLLGTSNYDPKQDVLRVSATPDTAQPHKEWMWIGFEDMTPSSANLVLRWQRLRLAVPITVDLEATVVAGLKREVANAERDAWRTPLRAATWCFDNSMALEAGAAWLEQSIAAEANHANLALKARWLAKDGKRTEAIATAKKAIAAGKAAKPPTNTAATERLVADCTRKK